jgi:thymidylate synthase
LPILSLNNRESIDEFSMEDIFLIGYKSHPALKAPMAV